MKTNYQILLPKWTITVNSEFEVLEDYAVVIEGSRIHSLLPAAEVRNLAFYQDAEIFDLPDHAIMPGLVNSHTHTAMSLFRGLADDLPLMEWLNKHIWPAESRWAKPEFVRDGFELAAAEMILSGTTCFSDMYFYPEVVGQLAQQIGLRAVVGLIVLDFPTVYAKNADDYLHKAMAVFDAIKSAPLVTASFAPHAPYTVSDKPLEKIAMYSSELDLPVHMHIHETAFEVAEAEKNTGMRPIQRLDQLNLLNPNLIAVHMTELNQFEIERISEAGVNVCHCPESNLKLGSGFCPVVQLQKNKVNICLGTDGAASNNDLDMFGEMRSAAMLAKGVSQDASACNLRQVIEMATINGARALGLGNDIGSIEEGKQADIIALDLSLLNTQPVYDPASQVVYAMNSRQVSHSWIAGSCQLADFQLCNLDADKIRHNAQNWKTRITSPEQESA